MKLSKLTVACLVALSGVSLSNVVNASTSIDGFEFSGYFRYGTYTSVENDYSLSEDDYVAQKETLGRLGLEVDDDANVGFSKTWDVNDGKSVKFSTSIDDDGTLSGGLEFKGITSSGTLWAGKMDYGKENYVWMTDFFYTDMSGTGVGIKGYEIGDLSFDLAYIASNRDDLDDDTEDDYYSENTNNDNLDNWMHAVNFAVTYDALKVSMLAKAMPDNWAEDGTKYATKGYDISVIYSLDNFFWIPGNGHAQIITQAGKGLGSGNLLAGTITSYNSYHPGSLFQGEHSDWTWASAGYGDATRLITYVDDGDSSARVILWGGYTFDNGISLNPAIEAQYNDHVNNSNGSYDYWIAGMVRPIFPVSEHFFVQAEMGRVLNNWDGTQYGQWKYTIAPTVIMSTGTGIDPQIRFTATYVDNAWTVDAGHDIIFGIQATVNI